MEFQEGLPPLTPSGFLSYVQGKSCVPVNSDLLSVLFCYFNVFSVFLCIYFIYLTYLIYFLYIFILIHVHIRKRLHIQV